MEAKDNDYVPFGEDHAEYKWVDGILNGLGKVRFVRVPNRSARTLPFIVQKYVQSSNNINSDGWGGYYLQSNHGHRHSVAIGELNHEDPNTSTHKETIEGAWVEVRAWSRRFL